MTRPLTPKQRVFIKEYVKCRNGTEAIRRAYPNVKKDLTRRVMAHENLTKPNIKSELERIFEEQGLSDEWIVSELKKTINEAKHTRDKLTGLRLSADMKGLTKQNQTIVQQGGLFQLTEADNQLLRNKLKPVEGTVESDKKV